jgi:hypothetical protein
MGSPGRIASCNIYLCNSFKLSPSQRRLSLFSKTTTALPPPLKKAEIRESAMAHLNILLAPQDPSLLSSLLSSKKDDSTKWVKEIMPMPV